MSEPVHAAAEVEQTLRLVRDDIEKEIANFRAVLFGLSAVLMAVLGRLFPDLPTTPLLMSLFGIVVALAIRWRVQRKGAELWVAALGTIFDLTATTAVFLIIHADHPNPADPLIRPMQVAILAVLLIELLAIASLRMSNASALASTAVALVLFVYTGHLLVGFHVGLLVSTGLMVFMAPFSYLVARRARKNLNVFSRLQLLRRYLAPAAVERILREHPDQALAVGGRLVTVTMLAADLRGFTHLSESLPPEEIVTQLNEYHQTMLEQIDRAGGSLDKFIGDGTLAVFGLTPAGVTPLDAGAQAAVDCAEGMLQALEQLNHRRAERKLAPLKMGIGIHTGVVVAGNIGAPGRRLEFTVIGDAVNTAARLEGMTKELGRTVLVSEATVGRLSRKGALSPIEPLRLRGKDQPIAACAL